jgi:NAD(P)H-flavin reductase
MPEIEVLGAAVAVAAIVVIGIAFTVLKKPKVFLDKTRQKLTLVTKTQLSHDTYRFRFALPEPSMVSVCAQNALGAHRPRARFRGCATSSSSERETLTRHVEERTGASVVSSDSRGEESAVAKTASTRPAIAAPHACSLTIAVLSLPFLARPRHALACQILGLPVGKHFKVFAPNRAGVVAGEWNGREDPEASASEIQRSYTPTTSDSTRGHVELVIKAYKAGEVERFPDGGKMSQYMAGLAVGDAMSLQGPFGSIEYAGRGLFRHSKRELPVCAEIGMLAGGTGITPMLQVIAAVLAENSRIKVALLYANQTEADILVRAELEALAAAHPDRFRLHYTIDRPPTDGSWKHSTGFIDQAMISAHLPAPGPKTVVLMCGPPPMIKFACKANLDALGYEKGNQLAF